MKVFDGMVEAKRVFFIRRENFCGWRVPVTTSGRSLVRPHPAFVKNVVKTFFIGALTLANGTSEKEDKPRNKFVTYLYSNYDTKEH